MPDCSCPDSAQHHLQCKYMHSILNQSTPGIHCQQCCVLNESLFQPEQYYYDAPNLIWALIKTTVNKEELIF